MSLLLSTGSVHHLEPETAFWLAHYARFDGVEVIIDSRMAAETLEGVAGFARQYKTSVHNVHAPFSLMEDWGDHWARVRRSLDWAMELKSKLLVIHPYASLKFIGRQRRVFSRRLGGLRDAAGAEGITVALENLPRSHHPLKYVNSKMGRFESIVDLARERDVKLTFDTTHMGTWGVRIVDAYRNVHDLVANIHLSDYAPGRQHLLPKHGNLPLSGFLVAAHQAGYEGPITLEVCPEALRYAEPDQALPILIKTRKWLKRHSGRKDFNRD